MELEYVWSELSGDCPKDARGENNVIANKTVKRTARIVRRFIKYPRPEVLPHVTFKGYGKEMEKRSLYAILTNESKRYRKKLKENTEILRRILPLSNPRRNT
jgi:hypothetical protein